MVSHHAAKFGGLRHCYGGDTTFLVVEEQDFTCCPLDLALLFISKAHGLKVHGILLIDVILVYTPRDFSKHFLLLLFCGKNSIFS